LSDYLFPIAGLQRPAKKNHGKAAMVFGGLLVAVIRLITPPDKNHCLAVFLQIWIEYHFQ
jgi:hypothetical protein